MNKLWNWGIGLIVVFLIAFLIVVSVTNDNETETIRIGVVYPLSGDMAFYGDSMKGAVLLAAEDINYEIFGKKIEFIFEDGKCTIDGGTQAFNKLINIDKVNFILGGSCSSETIGGAPIAEQAKVISISPSSSSPEIRKIGEYNFTLWPLDDFEGKFHADFINKMGLKNAYVIYEQNDWASGEKVSFITAFKKVGGTILGEEGLSISTPEFKTIILKLNNTNPDVIFLAGLNQVVINFLKEYKELDINVPVFIPQALQQVVLDAVGNAAEGKYGSYQDFSINYPGFEDKLKTITGLDKVDAQVLSPKAYDSLLLLKASIEKAETFDSEKVKDALLDIDFNGISGTYIFDEFGTPAIADYKMYKIVDGKQVVIN